jgi:delta1-piperideine-2-carboxylate reductase
LLRLPGYIATLKSGWVDGLAVPIVVDAAPGLVATEAANGFARPALSAASMISYLAMTTGSSAGP